MHGSLYTDPAIYEAELEHIWYRTWVYVGHVSEVPEPNDYVVKSIGPQPVIMTRDKQGEIHLLLNRCTHRANLVCDAAKGNSSAFRCPYHGWTFANTGKLLGYPFNCGYGGREAKKDLGLGRVARVAEHPRLRVRLVRRGGPDARASTSAPPPTLRPPRRAVARAARSSSRPAGCRHKVKANWKMLLENETDGYHPQFVHASIFSVAKSGIGDLYGEKSTRGRARPRQRPHRERPAPGVPPHRPADGLVRHDRGSRARLRRADARQARRRAPTRS